MMILPKMILKLSVNLLKLKKKEYEDFWNTLEVILRAGLPPRGKGRWKSTFDILGRK
jgi:hypothetical protein